MAVERLELYKCDSCGKEHTHRVDAIGGLRPNYLKITNESGRAWVVCSNKCMTALGKKLEDETASSSSPQVPSMQEMLQEALQTPL